MRTTWLARNSSEAIEATRGAPVSASRRLSRTSAVGTRRMCCWGGRHWARMGLFEKALRNGFRGCIHSTWLRDRAEWRRRGAGVAEGAATIGQFPAMQDHATGCAPQPGGGGETGDGDRGLSGVGVGWNRSLLGQTRLWRKCARGSQRGRRWQLVSIQGYHGCCRRRCVADGAGSLFAVSCRSFEVVSRQAQAKGKKGWKFAKARLMEFPGPGLGERMH